MIELHKQFTSMHKWKTKDTPKNGPQLIEYVKHMDHMFAEIDRLTQKLPSRKVMGVNETDRARFITAARHARNFSIEQMKQIITKSQSCINYRLAT